MLRGEHNPRPARKQNVSCGLRQPGTWDPPIPNTSLLERDRAWGWFPGYWAVHWVLLKSAYPRECSCLPQKPPRGLVCQKAREPSGERQRDLEYRPPEGNWEVLDPLVGSGQHSLVFTVSWGWSSGKMQCRAGARSCNSCGKNKFHISLVFGSSGFEFCPSPSPFVLPSGSR